MEKHYVYIMASNSRRLYVGVTNNLLRRVGEHKQEVNPGFTQRYQMKSLVYYEILADRPSADRREREIKGGAEIGSWSWSRRRIRNGRI
jgi:putative endonuclease